MRVSSPPFFTRVKHRVEGNADRERRGRLRLHPAASDIASCHPKMAMCQTIHRRLMRPLSVCRGGTCYLRMHTKISPRTT
eukprot:scaffold11391_cov70-Phaeocystis_antarctica.AAC.3